MASVVDICNLALANLGHAAKVSSIAPQDGSVESMHCARFYPIARDLVLSKHDWGFATRRALLAELAVDANVYADYEYAYALPANYLRFIGFAEGGDGLLQKTTFNHQVESLDSGAQILLTDCAPSGAYIRYVFKEENSTRYSATFVVCLGYELAAMLAGPIRKGDQRDNMLKAAAVALLTAAGVDSNVDNREQQRRRDYQPPWIAGR